jgi:mannose-6-phosphate isomerase-like protein (cupin superfamily)
MQIHKHSEITSADDAFFKVISTTDRCQVALMRLLPDKVSGAYGTEHPQADQVLIVMDGHGRAKIEGEEYEIEEGDVLVINAGEKHQIVADGAVSLRTMNIYAPVAYLDESHIKPTKEATTSHAKG